MLWRCLRILLAHHKIIPALLVKVEPKSWDPNQEPTYVRENITHEELIAAYGGAAYGLWDLLRD